MKCSAEWGIAIAFGTWYEFESETQSGIESETESGTQYEIMQIMQRKGYPF